MKKGKSKSIETPMGVQLKNYTEANFTNINEAVDWENIFNDIKFVQKNLRVGSEKESANIDIDENIAKAKFKCTRAGYSNRGNLEAYSYISDYGVVRVYSDGTIDPRGLEIVETGTNETFQEKLERDMKIEAVIKTLANGKKVCNKSTSAHITFVLGQHRPMPSIYIKNFLQLMRNYMDCVLWLTSAHYTDRSKRVVRDLLNQYASPLTTLDQQNPEIKTMKQIASTDRYSAVNFQNMSAEMGDTMITKLHLEIRIPDRTQVSYANVALKCLFQAMLLRAMRISEFGLLKSGNIIEVKERVKMMLEGKNLEEQIPTLQERSKRLVLSLKPDLESFDGQSVDVLSKMAEKPLSIMLRDGMNDGEIAKHLRPPMYFYEMTREQQLRQAMTLGMEKGNKIEWKKKVAEKLGTSPRQVERLIEKLSKTNNVEYDEELQQYTIQTR